MNRMVEIKIEDGIPRAFMLFVQTARAVERRADNSFFQALHLSTVKYIALKALEVSGGTLTHSALADWTGTVRHNITALAKRMEKEGLVTMKRSDEDKRFINITLTEKGRDLLKQAHKVARDIVDKLMAGIDERNAAQLERLMLLLQKNIEKASAPTIRQVIACKRSESLRGLVR